MSSISSAPTCRTVTGLIDKARDDMQLPSNFIGEQAAIGYGARHTQRLIDLKEKGIWKEYDTKLSAENITFTEVQAPLHKMVLMMAPYSIILDTNKRSNAPYVVAVYTHAQQQQLSDRGWHKCVFSHFNSDVSIPGGILSGVDFEITKRTLFTDQAMEAYFTKFPR